MTKTKIFFDAEFTGLHQNTTLISIGLVSECGKTFYAELTDYDKSQIDDWLQINVIDNLKLDYLKSEIENSGVTDKTDLENIKYRGTREHLKTELKSWLEQFDAIQIWSDCLAYDWVLFCSIFGDAFSIPDNIFYIPLDICTLFFAKGIDADISREAFTEQDKETEEKHNALYDAKVIEKCFNKLIKL